MTMRRWYEWPIDYERDREVFLTIGGTTSDMGAEINSSQLDPVAIQMLEASSCEYIVTPQVEQIDQRVRLCYPVTGLRLLSAELRSRPLSSAEFFRMLVEVTDRLVKGRDYLLQERNFALTSELIFMEGHTDAFKLVYLPLREVSQAPSISEQLKVLAEEWMEHAGQLSLEAWRGLLRQLDSDSFNLIEFRAWCSARMSEMTGSTPPGLAERSVPDLPTPDYVDREEIVGQAGGIDPVEDPIMRPELDYLQDLIPLEEAATSALLQRKPDSRLEKWMNQPLIWTAVILGLATALAVCFLFPFPGSEILLIAILAVVVLGLGAMVYWDKRREKSRLSLEDEDWPDPYGLFSREEAAPSSEMNRTPPLVEAMPATTVLSSPDRTVLLSAKPPSLEAGRRVAPQFCLVVRKQGLDQERLPLRTERYAIGRDRTAADRVSEQTGVSRIHCELFRVEDAGEPGYGLKDLGSVNGTYLNDGLLVPFKEYTLCDGDCIRIVEEEYVYRTER